jgi:hypothetical protein
MIILRKYVYENGFQSYAATKTKCRNRLNAAPDLRIPPFQYQAKRKENLSRKREEPLYALKIANIWYISF